MVSMVASITQQRIHKCLQLNISSAASREKKYTSTILASFIICRNATDKCMYAEFDRTSWTEKKTAIGATPFKIRPLSIVIFCLGSVSDGNQEGRST